MSNPFLARFDSPITLSSNFDNEASCHHQMNHSCWHEGEDSSDYNVYFDTTDGYDASPNSNFDANTPVSSQILFSDGAGSSQASKTSGETTAEPEIDIEEQETFLDACQYSPATFQDTTPSSLILVDVNAICSSSYFEKFTNELDDNDKFHDTQETMENDQIPSQNTIPTTRNDPELAYYDPDDKMNEKKQKMSNILLENIFMRNYESDMFLNGIDKYHQTTSHYQIKQVFSPWLIYLATIVIIFQQVVEPDVYQTHLDLPNVELKHREECPYPPRALPIPQVNTRISPIPEDATDDRFKGRKRPKKGSKTFILP